jgi:hypothetical protein
MSTTADSAYGGCGSGQCTAAGIRGLVVPTRLMHNPAGGCRGARQQTVPLTVTFWLTVGQAVVQQPAHISCQVSTHDVQGEVACSVTSGGDHVQCSWLADAVASRVMQ